MKTLTSTRAIILLLVFNFSFFIHSSLFSQASLAYAKQLASVSGAFNLGSTIKHDNSGNVYVGGIFGGQVDFDPGPGVVNLINSSSYEDSYITKFNPSGDLVWARQIGGNLNDKLTGIAYDAYGNVYATGIFQGTCDFDPGAGTYNLNGGTGYDMFVVKLDAAGNFVWARQFGNKSDVYGNEAEAINIDASGIYFTGAFADTTDFDPNGSTFYIQASSINATDAFVCKLDFNGGLVWAKAMGGTSSEKGYAITLDGSGNVYTTGFYTGTADFDPGSGVFHLNASSFDIFISKLSSMGNFIWAKSVGSTSTSEDIRDIVIDLTGNVIVCGGFSNTADFDPSSASYNLTSAGETDAFVLSLTSSGNFMWAKRMGGVNKDVAYDLSIGAANSIFVTGGFESVGDFDPGAGVFTLNSAGLHDVFVVRLDNSGSFICGAQWGSNNEDIGWAITADGNGTTWATGYFRNTVDFDPSSGTYNMTSMGNSDAFISKLTWNAPNVTTTTTHSLLCAGQSATLTASGAGNYSWSNGGNGSAIIVSPTSNTTYTVTGTSNGCINKTTITQNVSPCTVMEELASKEELFSVYPNPATNFVSVVCPPLEGAGGGIRIFNSIGEQILVKPLESGVNQIDLGNYPKGIYFVELHSEKQTVSKKLIVD